MIFVYVFILFLGAVLFSMLGLGGGVLYTPFFHFLGYKISQSATFSLFLIMFTTFFSAMSFLLHKKIRVRLALITALFMLLGSFLGGYISNFVSEIFLKFMFLLVMIFLLGKMLLKNKIFNFVTNNYPFLKYIFPFVFGLISSLLGIGGGAFLVPYFSGIFSLDINSAVATSSLVILIASIFGILGHLTCGEASFNNTIFIYAASVAIGGFIGAKFSMKISSKQLRSLFLLVITILIVITLFSK